MRQELNNMEALIFDLDGTLVDSMWMWKQIDIEYLGQFGIALPDDLQSKIEGMSFTETANYFKEHFPIPDPVEQIKEDWNRMAWDKYSTQVPMKPGVKELLSAARNKGIKLGIATSNSVELVENIVRVHGLETYFDAVKTSCEVERGKPSPDIYLLTAKTLGVEPEKCLVFEDIIAGIRAGLSAGMKVCAVEDEYSLSQTEEKKSLAHYYIRDFTQLGAWCEQ